MANINFTLYAYLTAIALFFGFSLVLFGCALTYWIGQFDYFLNASIIISPLLVILSGLLTIVVFTLIQFTTNKRYRLMFFVTLLIAEIGAVIFIFVKRARFAGYLREKYITSFSNYLFSTKDRDAWNHLQRNMQCCGKNKTSDWNKILRKGLVPISCCLVRRKYEESFCRYSKRKSNVYSAGCYDKLLDYLQPLTGYGLASILIAITLQVIVAVFVLAENKFWRDKKIRLLQ